MIKKLSNEILIWNKYCYLYDRLTIKKEIY